MSATIRVVDAVAAAPAGASIVVAIEVQNRGATAWIADTHSRGQVRIGAQLLDAERRPLDRNYARQPLPHDVPAGATACAALSCTVPAQPGWYSLKFDLVAEGVGWFESWGSTPGVHRLHVHEKPRP